VIAVGPNETVAILSPAEFSPMRQGNDEWYQREKDSRLYGR
jgi:hypothetical protein